MKRVVVLAIFTTLSIASNIIDEIESWINMVDTDLNFRQHHSSQNTAYYSKNEYYSEHLNSKPHQTQPNQWFEMNDPLKLIDKSEITDWCLSDGDADELIRGIREDDNTELFGDITDTINGDYQAGMFDNIMNGVDKDYLVKSFDDYVGGETNRDCLVESLDHVGNPVQLKDNINTYTELTNVMKQHEPADILISAESQHTNSEESSNSADDSDNTSDMYLIIDMIENKVPIMNFFWMPMTRSKCFLDIKDDPKPIVTIKAITQFINGWQLRLRHQITINQVTDDDIWTLFNRFFIPKTKHQKDSTINIETLFSLYIFDHFRSDEYLSALSAHVAERITQNPPPSIHFIQNPEIKGRTGVEFDEAIQYFSEASSKRKAAHLNLKRSYDAMNYSEEYIFNNIRFKSMIIHLNSIFAKDHYKNIILDKAKKSVHPTKLIPFSIRFHAFTSGDFMFPFFNLLDKMYSLAFKSPSIHTKYLKQIDKILEKFEKRIFAILGNKDLKIIQVETLLANKHGDLYPTRLATDDYEIRNAINDLMTVWLGEIEASNIKDAIDIKYMILNATTVISKVINGVQALLKIIGVKTSTRDTYFYRFDDIFDELFFDSFDPSKIQMIFQTAVELAVKRNSKKPKARATTMTSICN